MEILTYPTVEEAVKQRVLMKARAYGQEVTPHDGNGADRSDTFFCVDKSVTSVVIKVAFFFPLLILFLKFMQGVCCFLRL